MKRIRNMSFPNHDHNWTDVIELLKSNNWDECKIIAPVEFCEQFEQCFPNEWSYWNSMDSYDLLILHKGQLDRFKNNWLDDVDTDYDYVFGNAVFNVYVKKHLNSKQLKGHSVHFSIHSIINGLKKLLKIGKQYKTDSNKKNILLVTANHSGNIGDDAITLASKKILQSVYPHANIVVDKGPASKELISKVDMVVLGGGGIFYDGCFYNVQNYCQYLLYAKELSVPSLGIGIGAQSIMTTYGIELFKHAINGMEAIFVRDDVSSQILTRRVGVSIPVLVNRDVVFTLDFAETEVAKNTIVNKKPKLLCSLIDTNKVMVSEEAKEFAKQYYANQMECMAYLCEHFDVTCFVQSEDDLSLYQIFKKKFNVNIAKLQMDQIQSDVMLHYKNSDLVITSRLHGYIFSVLAGVPVISVVADSIRAKHAGLIKNYIPSSDCAIIPQDQYSLSKLESFINRFFENQSQFEANKEEVNACIEKSKEIAIEIKSRMGEL